MLPFGKLIVRVHQTQSLTIILPSSGQDWFGFGFSFLCPNLVTGLCHFEPLASLLASCFCPPCFLTFFPDFCSPYCPGGIADSKGGMAFRRMLELLGFSTARSTGFLILLLFLIQLVLAEIVKSNLGRGRRLTWKVSTNGWFKI